MQSKKLEREAKKEVSGRSAFGLQCRLRRITLFCIVTWYGMDGRRIVVRFPPEADFSLS
jgi:hypothetical protein